MKKTYSWDEIEYLKRRSGYNCFGCSSCYVRRYFTLNMPNINRGHNGYTVSYTDYTEDNKVYLQLTYDISKLDNFQEVFGEVFGEVFAQLTNFDLNFAAEKIIKISDIHNRSYEKFYKPEFSKVDREYVTAITNKGKFILNNIDDKSIKIKQLYVNKTFAFVGDFVVGLDLGNFEYKNNKLVRNEATNLYEVNEKYTFEDLKAAGFVFDDPKNMGGWKLPTSRVDKVMQIRRPITEDVELYKYISETINNVDYQGLELNKKIDLR